MRQFHILFHSFERTFNIGAQTVKFVPWQQVLKEF